MTSTHSAPEFARSFPFRIAALPFFYGWVILVMGTLGVLMSAPGQTVGVSVFNLDLQQAHSLSSEALSMAYALGTAGSALMITLAGKVYDRLGGRWVTVVASLCLAIVLVSLSYSVQIRDHLQPWLPQSLQASVSFGVMAVLFLALRFFGQGVMTLSSRNMVMEWFSQRRGMATAVIGMSVAFGFSITPKILDALIQPWGWQGAWRCLALVLVVFAGLTAIIARARPEDHGLKPDGNLQPGPRPNHAETAVGRDFTLQQARRTYSFWIFTLTGLLAGLLMTAFTFHLVSTFQDAGLSRQQAVNFLIPVAFISVTVELIGSWASNHLRLKYLAMVQLAGVVLMTLGLSQLAEGWPIAIAAMGAGMMQGMFGIISGLTWPRFFGRQHLGAISGFSTSLIVLGTAFGPLLFSFAHQQTGSYQPAVIGCGAAGFLLLLAATRANRPE